MTDQRNMFIWTVEKDVDNLAESHHIQEAAERLIQNEVVAFPTETVYGLGGNAQSDKAIDRIFQAKGRPSDNPLIVHIAKRDDVKRYVEKTNELGEKLMNAFWPGPLTLVFRHNGRLSTKVTAGLDTVGIRMPDHPVALAVIEASGLPIAAPSANTSGRPSPTTAAHVQEDLRGKIAGIVDGGATGVGLESTVVDCTGEEPMILRPGGITKEQLEAVVGKVAVDPSLAQEKEAPRSPGMKYTHYAPKAEMILVDGSDRFFQEQIDKANRKGLNAGILVPVEKSETFSGMRRQEICGTESDISTVARELYGALRSFDSGEAVDVIFARTVGEAALGQAVMNRLRKAAGNRVLTENELQK
ncbi:threonylcarbamoyl-AMP synthase [Bacillus sp. H-16]|uniref:L-threonylcarbamoyladenylate synthase n=1 Tax=Alteribacter salitolerans TaxID=2912333 RepID=UPI001963A7AD|nr:threonylcarbamoyl-AMP synthase [Alteribacter salitolerans]